MKWVLYAFSMAWICFGSLAILYTTPTRETLRNILKTDHLKPMATLPVLMGILLLISSSASHYPWFIRLLGLLAMAKGVFIFSISAEIADKLRDWYLDSMSDQTYRLCGIITIILGSALFSWIL